MDRLLPETIDFHIEPGDVFLLYTDGMTDALNAAGDEFGLARLQAVPAQSHHLDARSIADALM